MPDSQLMHGPMMTIFKSVRAIPSTDVVQTFECDPLNGSQVRVHTNIKKKDKKKAKTDAAKINNFRKTPFSGGKKSFVQEPGGQYTQAAKNLLWIVLKDTTTHSNEFISGDGMMQVEIDFWHKKPTPPPLPVHLGFWTRL